MSMKYDWVAVAVCAGLTGAAGSSAYAASAPGVVITTVTAGFPDPNGVVPNFNVASGAGIPTWDSGVPHSILRIGNTYVYAMTMQNTTFDGKCTASYALTQVQGGTNVTLDSAVYQSKFDCAPSNIFGWFLSGKPIPNTAGPATLTAIVHYGKKTIKLSAPMLIEP
jgi:hypothetical protein